MEQKPSESTPPKDSSAKTQEPPQKQKWWRGPRPLSPEEKKTAKYAFGLAIFGVVTFFLQFFYFYFFDTTGDFLVVMILWITFLMPGYAANAGMSIWGGKGPAMDLGHVCKDGRRLFGPGKTWRGFILGPLGFGIPLALFVHWIFFAEWGLIIATANGFLATGSEYRFYDSNSTKLISDLALFMLGDKNAIHPEDATLNLFLTRIVPRVILCAYGAPVGDLVKSWAKRRKGLERGEPWWLLDQLDFVVGCLLFAGWYVFIEFTVITFHIMIMTLFITPTITVVANTINYFSGHKKVPW